MVSYIFFSGNASYSLLDNYEDVFISSGLFLGTSITFKVKLFDTDRAISYDEKEEKLVSESLDSI